MIRVRRRDPDDPKRCDECRSAFALHVIEATHGRVGLCDFCLQALDRLIDSYMGVVKTPMN